MFVDLLIPRLTKAGLNVSDIRAQLPRNGRYAGRSISAITKIAWHYDAAYRPKLYDSLRRYVDQAQYHVNKDWGGGSRGDGLMYSIKVDNVGDVYICRDFEDILWHVGGAPNGYSVSLNIDCGGDQLPTREQVETE